MQRMGRTANSVAANLTGFASNVTGAAFTLTANVSGDGLGHQVTIRNDSVTNHSGKTVTLVGTDPDGNAQTEVVTGPNTSATVTSTKYWGSLTSATPSASIGADTFDIGWGVNSASPSVNLVSVPQGTLGVGCTVDSGSPTYSAQVSYDGVVWNTHATITAKTANFADSITIPCLGVRLIFTAAGQVTMNVVVPTR